MIYLFNDVKELTGTVRNNHILNLLYEREKNGIYSVSAEIPVTYNDQGTIYNYNKKIQKSDFLGHYDKEGRFQLHKIAAVDIENGSIFVKGIHIFFDEAKAGAIIKDRRFVNREIIDGARVAFESIGWSVVDFDVSVGKTYNFYNVTPLEARQILVETFGFEFDYWLDFDGKKVTNRHVAVKEKIGEKTNKRYTYGHNVLNIRAEQDYSEIYTAVIGRGKGEEIEETGGYGRRIEYTDVVWSTPSKPLNKPAGTRVLEDPNATQLCGYKENGVVKPRVKVEVFSDIESPTELIQASYEWLMDNNVPKAVFSLKVADGDGLNLGDEVYVIYRDIDLVKSARVEKVIDDLVSGNRDVEFGDTAYFDTDRRLSGLRKDLKRYSGETGDRIYRLKMEFNRRFDEEVSSWVAEFEQNLIDQQAQIEADRENMTNLIEGTRMEFTDNLNAEITQTKEYAEQQAQSKAEEVRTDLETVTSGHQAMLDSLQDNVMSIDDFLGNSREITLDERFQDITQEFEERIRNIDSTHYNMIRGTSFDNPDLFSKHAQVELITNEVDNFVRMGTGTTNIPYVMNSQYFKIEGGKEYHLVFMYRTTEVPEVDFVEFRTASGTNEPLRLHDILPVEVFKTEMTGQWTKKVITFKNDEDRNVRLFLGTNFGVGNTEKGVIDIKKPYLTTTNNREWLPHPDDDTQNVSEIVRRVTLLEDGQSELITRSEYDFDTGNLDQYIKSVEETVEGNKQVLQRVDNWQATNGASIEETIYGFDQKVWLNDVANIGANLIPQSSNAWEDGGLWIEGGGEAAVPRNIRTKERIKIQPSKTYTLSSNSSYVSAIERVDIYQYLTTGGWLNRYTIPRNGEVTFTTWSTAETVRITLVAREGFSIHTNFIDHPDGRIKVKLEVGDKATPMLNAISRFEQLADKVAIQVQELDGNFLTQSDIQVQAGYVQLGSQRLGDEQLASIFRVSPNSIDAITERMTLNGDLYVDGDITALAVQAIEGNFARLFANQLTANVITSDHIQVGTALVDKMFATSARIDQLITKTHFVNEMHALTLNVVDLNASQIRTRLLSANTIEASWIKSGTALLDRVFSSTAMFERMMAKSAFVTTLSTITLDLHELTIWRPDGVAVIQNGMQRFGLPVTFVQQVSGGGAGDVSVQTNYWETNARSAQQVGGIYTEHAGRWLNVGVGVGLRADADHASTKMAVVIRPSNIPSGASWPSAHIEEFTVYRGSTDYYNINVPLGRPTFGAASWTLEFYRIGDNNRNPVQLRRRRIWISA